MSDTFQYRVGFDADTSGLDKATSAVDDLSSTLDSLGSSTVDIDTDEATRKVQQLVEDVDKLSSEDAVVQLSLARNDIAEQVATIAETIEKLDASDPQIDIEMAHGDVLLGQIETIDTKLRAIASQKAEPQVDLAGSGQVISDLGDVSGKLEQIAGTRAEAQVELSNSGQVIGDLEQVESKVKELDGQTAEVRVDTSSATHNIEKLSDSGRGAHSALANMVGNSAQDLGALGGISRSAGVAIGQMAEYASDATLAGENLGKALRSMAGVVGPIAALAAGVQIVGAVLGGAKERAGLAADEMERLNKIASEGGDVIGNYAESLQEFGTSSADVQQGLLGFTKMFFGLETGITDVTDELDLAGVTLREFSRGVTGTQQEAQALQAAFDAAADGGKITQAQWEALTSALSEARVEWGTTADGVTKANRLMAVSTQDVNDALDALASKDDPFKGLFNQSVDISGTMIDAGIAWNGFVDDLRDGHADVAETGSLVTQFADLLGVSTDKVLELATAQTQGATAAAKYRDAMRVVGDQVTMWNSIATAQAAATAETERMTFTQQELNDAIRASADPTATMSDQWAALIHDFRDGQFDLEGALGSINAIAAATGQDPGQIFTLIKQQADAANQAATDLLTNVGAAIDKINADQVAGLADAFGQLRDAKIAGAADAIDNITAAFENQVGAIADGIGAVRDYQDAVAEAGRTIAGITDDVPDFVGDLSAEFGKVNDLFSGLAFDVDFQPALDKALDDLNSFKPDLQTTADEWATILKGQPIDIFGNVRADDAAFLEKVGNLRTLFQEGVVNEFEQGGVDAANAFVRSTAEQIASSTNLSIADVYKVMGLPPDGTITTLIAPEVSQQHADQARSVLDAIAGTSDDPRIAELQVKLETGQIDGDLAYVESLLLAQDLGIPVSLEGIPQADIDAAQADLAGHPLTVSTHADITGAVADIDGVATQEHVATILAHADTSAAASQLDGVAAGWFGGLWPGGIRTATITAEAETDAAASELAAFIAQKRQLIVDAILGSVPSNSEIIARIGAVSVPIDYYVRSDPRVNGSRSTSRVG